jgi:hypothetical protein
MRQIIAANITGTYVSFSGNLVFVTPVNIPYPLTSYYGSYLDMSGTNIINPSYVSGGTCRAYKNGTIDTGGRAANFPCTFDASGGGIVY